MAACPKLRTRALRPRPAHLLALGSALASLALAAPAQARCQVWRVLASEDEAHLRDLALRMDADGMLEFAHLGVVDGPSGATSCELSIDETEIEIECEWLVDSAEAGARLIADMQRDIEACTGEVMEVGTDFTSASTGSSFTNKRDLEIEFDQEYDYRAVDFELNLYTVRSSTGRERREVNLYYSRER